MVPDTGLDTRSRIIHKARELGASLAGIASVAELQRSPSYSIYDESPYYDGYKGVEWPAYARSVLVLALVHSPSEPELDWWSDIPGRTKGNRQLVDIAESLTAWLAIDAYPLPYRLEQGGILLKDAAVLAGLGVIGKNNLVITPEFGPRVRLRGVFLDVDLEPSGPIEFDPCEGCDMPCRRACPRQAFRSGSYSRALCDLQMDEDVANSELLENWVEDESRSKVVKYCRACELACPVA
jgi:epoxyqueuosine reductase